MGVLGDFGVGGGRLMVPWISRIARPVGVWRSWGRGFEMRAFMLSGEGRWMGMVGIVVAGHYVMVMRRKGFVRRRMM